MPRKGENIYKRKDNRWEGRYLDWYKKYNFKPFDAVTDFLWLFRVGYVIVQ